MNGLNRFFIFILLLALLYALWRYQQYILGADEDDDPVPQIADKPKKKGRKHRYAKKLIDEESMDNITIDNVSQFSLGSLEDLKTNDGANPYKQDSILDSLDTGDNLSFLDDASRDSRGSFFFEEANF